MLVGFSIPAPAAARRCGRSRATVACFVPTARFRVRRSKPSVRMGRVLLRAVADNHHGKRGGPLTHSTACYRISLAAQHESAITRGQTRAARGVENKAAKQ